MLVSTDAVIAARGNLADCDQAFHLAIVGAAHNSVLTRVLNSIYHLSLPLMERHLGNARVYWRDVLAPPVRPSERRPAGARVGS